jgi:tRNA-dihydrouridine synthase A
MIRRFCIAPMMERTDRHERVFLRCITKQAFLYTEMIHINTILYGDRVPLLSYNNVEHPLAIQLGGSDPTKLAACATLAEELGFKEVNLNVGCPSKKVQNGSFGAILMLNPLLVAKCIKAMSKACSIPVTIKCRIGVDDMCEENGLSNFIKIIADAGVKTFIIHARKAMLKGLNPKQNREIPPLNYSRVYKLKEEFFDKEIIINGGIKTLEDCNNHLKYIDGVMMGREAYDNPFILREVDYKIYGNDYKSLTREDILLNFLPYIEKQQTQGVSIQNITKHLMGLYKGTNLAKKNRLFFAELIKDPDPVSSIRSLVSV